MRTLCLHFLRAYQRWISPALGSRCRFYPSCSHYAIASIERFGTARGILLAGGRILRCQPFSSGGMDPVPEQFPVQLWRGTRTIRKNPEMPVGKSDLHAAACEHQHDP